MSTRQSAVINGTTDLLNAFPFVGTWGCSAVAIAPNVVLSAAHCLPPGVAQGCGTWVPTLIAFPGVGGNTTDPGTVTSTAVAMRPHPSLFDAGLCPNPEGEICTKDAVSCEQTICDDKITPEAGIFTAQTWRGDIIALLVDPPLPADRVGKVLVHPSFANPSKGLIANGQNLGANVQLWSFVEKPNVTIVGYGANNFPNARAYGIMRWYDFQYEPGRVGWALGWKSCIARDAHERIPQIMLDANGYTFPDPPSPPYAPDTLCDFWVPGTPFPDAQGYAMIGAGDSGGPVVIGGTTPGKGGLVPTPMPSFIDAPNEPITVGIASVGSCSYAAYAPTYTPETSQWISNLVTDSDGDGLPDPFDNCNHPPGGLPWFNTDSDGDGTPDFCDVCPFEAHPLGATKSDADSDGVCASLDNCKNAFNPTQQNDNEEAEDKHGAERLGNACEPVPVPNFYTEFTTSEENCKFAGSLLFRECEVLTKLTPGTGIKADLQGSHSPAGELKSLPVPTTETRFCWNKAPIVQGSINCLGNIAIADQFQEFALGDEVSTTPFHRLTINGQALEISHLNLRTYSFAQREPVSWNYAADLIFWAFQGYPNTGLPDLGEERFGRLWMHATTSVGMTVNFLNTGLHKKLDGSAGEQLANHYESLYPIARQKVVEFSNDPVDDPLSGIGCWGGECAVAPALPLNDCIACDLIHPGDVVSRPGEWRIVHDIPGRGLHYLAEAGGFLPLPEPAATPSIRALFQSGARRMASAEPLRGRGLGTSIPSVLFLEDDGLSIRDGLSILGGRAFTTSEARTQLLELGGRAGLPGFPQPESYPSLGIALSSAPMPTPRAESSKAMVYSTTMGLLFLLRGQDKPNQPAADLWFQSVREGSGYYNVPLTGEIGRVLSATFTPVDRKLWVLDEKKGKWGFSKVRLLSVNPVSGQVKEWASWPNLGVFEQRWLLTDQDGNLLLASSSSALRKHTLSRVDVKGPPRVTARLVRDGKLHEKPIVEPAGYRFLIESKSKKNKLFKIERVQSLPEKEHPFEELASCL